MEKILNVTKEDLVVKAAPIENKIVAADMNNIKNVVNNNADEAGNSADLNTTDKSTIVAGVNEVKTQIVNHEADLANPHQVTKAQVGLGNADDTSDADKPVSDDTQAALDLKSDDTTVVHKTGDLTEDVTGRKTFKDQLKVDYTGANSVTIKDKQIYIFDESGRETYIEDGSIDVDTEGGTYKNRVNLPRSTTENTTTDFQNKSGTVALTSDFDILRNGSDAYTHAERGVTDGFEVERLVQLDQVIEANLRTPFYWEAGFSKGVSKMGTAVPDVSNADWSLTRNSEATFVNKRGLIETAAANVPRFDWSRGYSVLLKEDESTNLFLQSNDFDNASWTKTFNGLGSAPAITPSFGSIFGLNAVKIKFNPATGGDSGNSRLSQAVSVSEESNHTQWYYIQSLSGVQTITTLFAGFTNTITVTEEPQLISSTSMLTVANWTSGIYMDENNTYTSGEFLLAHAQLEKGNKPTSAIFTTTTIQARQAETNVKTGDISFLSKNNFALNIQGVFNSNDQGDGKYSYNDTTNNNRIDLFGHSVDGKIKLYLEAGGVPVFNEDILIGDKTKMRKYIPKIKSGDTSLFVDGVLFYRNTSEFNFNNNFSQLGCLNPAGNADFVKGETKVLAIEDFEFSDSTATTLEELDATLTNYNIR